MSRMSRADRAAWRSARTLADLGRLGAQWLEGDLAMQPAWRAGPDEETQPLIPALAALNRAGFYTTASSPGDDGTCSGNVHWRQRAAVEGFADADLAGRLYLAAHEAGLITVTHDPATLPRKHWDKALEIAVTERDGSPYTWFGQQWSRREIRSRRHWGTCRRAAQDALCSAWQVTIVDPEWVREDLLWDVLAQVADARTPAEVVP
jgi:hypothetical protein